VNEDTHDSRPAQNQNAPATRRKFLRQIGMTGAATAMVVGLADVAGVKPAFAATKATPKSRGVLTSPNLPAQAQKRIQEIRARTTADPDTAYFVGCSPTPGECGGPCEPAGVWCHWCCYESGYCGGREISCWRSCIGGDYYFCSEV
jgi:hypothetical protein